MKFVGTVFIVYAASVASIYMGLHFNNGWVTAAGIIALLCHSIKVDDDKEKK